MFSYGQKREHIKELQRFLHEISYYNPRIPRINPDGIYGQETSDAVKIFQREYGLTATGNADSDTWKKLAEVNSFYYPAIIRPDVFGNDTVIIPGSAGPAVYFIQVMLNTIGNGYKNMPVIELTGIYDAPTERSVNMYKRVSGSNVGREGVDAELWNKIVSSFNKEVIL